MMTETPAAAPVTATHQAWRDAKANLQAFYDSPGHKAAVAAGFTKASPQEMRLRDLVCIASLNLMAERQPAVDAQRKAERAERRAARKAAGEAA